MAIEDKVKIQCSRCGVMLMVKNITGKSERIIKCPRCQQALLLNFGKMNPVSPAQVRQPVPVSPERPVPQLSEQRVIQVSQRVAPTQQEASKPLAPTSMSADSPMSSQPPVKKGKGMAIALVLSLLLLVVGGVVWHLTSQKDSATSESASAEIADQQVSDLYFESSLGVGSYSGPVDAGKKPHGMGKLNLSNGKSYEGPFVHGIMEGDDVTFTLENGDIFVGSFENDAFSRGRYTIKTDGSYFEGTFSNGNPDVGQWFDKSGNPI